MYGTPYRGGLNRRKDTVQMNLTKLLTEADMSLDLVLWSMFIGIVIGALAIFYNKKIGGAVVRKLFDEKSTDPSTAMTLTQMGLQKNFLIRFALRRGSGLRKVVLSVEEDAKVTDETAFYLPEEKYPRAALQYDNNGTSIFTVFLAVILFAVMILIIRALMPDMLQLVKNFTDMVRGE